MSTPPAPARVFGFVAAEADVCVLLRRGPSKQVLMVRWDLRTDEFEIGQWLKARVYEWACGLSEDGRIFRYTAQSARTRPNVIGRLTALCRPPYFTALALWENPSPQEPDLRWMEEKPRRVSLPDLGAIPEEYRSKVPESLYERRGYVWHIRSHAQAGSIAADWSDVDRRGRLLYARAGRVYVRDAGGERELIDLNPLSFRPLAPPDWATRWP